MASMDYGRQRLDVHRAWRNRLPCLRGNSGWHSLILILALFLTACVANTAAPHSDGTHSEDEGTQPSAISFRTPGVLLSVQAQPPAAALQHAGRRYLFTYRSRGVEGEPIVASAYALLPKGPPPRNGWPVLVWAHGTTGVADICAPSGSYPGGPVDDYQQAVLPVLDWWLARGYAVVAPDYQGLGTPGGHPYMNAASQLHTVDDAVRAIHGLRTGKFSANWLVMGHSQGGAAALEVAAHGQADMPEFRLRGAIAIAPGGYDYAGIAQYAVKHPRLELGVAAFFPIVLLGAQAADPSLQVDELVGPDMRALLNLARSRCLSGLRDAIHRSPGAVFKDNANLAPLLKYLDRQSIERMSPEVPVLLVQGSADALVDPRGTRAYCRQLHEAGKVVFFHTMADGSHRDALIQSPAATGPFLEYLAGSAHRTSPRLKATGVRPCY